MFAVSIPMIFSFFGQDDLPFLWTYPLTEERQARIRRRLEAKAARLEATLSSGYATRGA